MMNEIEKKLKTIIDSIADGIVKNFDATIYKTEIINLKTHENKGPFMIWQGLPIPKLKDYNSFYLNIISFQIDEMDYIVMRNGHSSVHNDWDVENYISEKLGGQLVATGGAYQIENVKYRICKWYYVN